MQRLVDMVEGRAVAVLCQGPSINQMARRDAQRLRDAGCVIAGVNRWWLTSPRLGPPQIAWCAALPRIDEGHRQLYLWLRTDPGRLLLTRPSGLRRFDHHERVGLSTIRRQIIPFHCENENAPVPEDTVKLFPPVGWEVISVAAMVLALEKAGADKIGVFGHDGGTGYCNGKGRAETINRDIDALNANWINLHASTGTEHYTPIVNANPESRCECWLKMDYSEAIEWLVS